MPRCPRDCFLAGIHWRLGFRSLEPQSTEKLYPWWVFDFAVLINGDWALCFRFFKFSFLYFSRQLSKQTSQSNPKNSPSASLMKSPCRHFATSHRHTMRKPVFDRWERLHSVWLLVKWEKTIMKYLTKCGWYNKPYFTILFHWIPVRDHVLFIRNKNAIVCLPFLTNFDLLFLLPR